MAKIFVDSASGSNTSPYETEAKAATTLQTALTAWTDGDEILVLDSHNEGTATASLTAANATLANRVPVSRIATGESYSATTGADTIQYDASSAGADINFNFSGAIRGLNFSANDNISISTASGTSTAVEDCYFKTNTNDAQIIVGTGNADSALYSRGNTYELAHANGGSMRIQGHQEFNCDVFLGYANSTGLFNSRNTTRASRVVFRGCDFSGMSSAATIPLVDTSFGTDNNQEWHFISCDVQASQVYHDSAFGNDAQFVYVHNTDNAGNTYETARYGFRGNVQTDTGVYYGGTDAYQDYDGTTSLSHKMVPASNVDIASPLISLDMFALIESTGSKTFTIEVAENYTAALNKRDCWIEVFYLGGASESIWSMAYDREIAASSYTSLTAGSGLGDWTAEPSGSRSAKVTATATVNQVGVFMVRLFLANYESGKEFYYNPKVTVT